MDPDQFREILIQVTDGHKCIAEQIPPAERAEGLEAFRAEHLQLATDELGAAKDRYKLPA